jgi:demethylmenaquinone methyltransferase/2-methoxy-6-polyprenyl-1,4-benzoquinol methylase
VRRTKEEAQATYDRLSRWYDLLAAGSEGPHVEAGVQMLDVQEGERILEIGFGTGRGLVGLARDTGGSGGVYGLDISWGMVREARRRLVEAGCGSDVGLMLADGAQLPLASGSFDAAFMSFSLELFDTPRLEQVLTGCRRVLGAGGRLCVVSMAKRGRGSLSVRVYEWVHKTMPRWVDCRPIPVRDVLERAGYEILAVEERSMWTIPVHVVLARPVEEA